MAEDLNRFIVWFECADLEPSMFRVVGMEGREELSRPFELRVRVRIQEDVPLLESEIEALLRAQATISFGPEREHPIHGVVRSVRLMSISGRAGEYELRVVPRLVDTALTRGSWIHQEKTVGEIITASFALGGETPLKEAEDFELQLDSSYQPLEYVVQYEESLFSFISRQAEHFGIFYFFDHVGEREKIVFGDGNACFPKLEGFEAIAFEPRGRDTATEAVQSFGFEQHVVSRRVSLRDYNYRIPSVELVTAPVAIDATGIGDVHLTGDHFATPQHGDAFAVIRSQELFAQRRRVHVRTTVRGLRAGHRFTLEGTEPELFGLAGEYFVVAAVHRYDPAEGEGREYWNELELLPFDVAFRPARVTAKPRIVGVMHAKIDSESDDDEVHVPVDEWGRYKVVMPFDVAGKKGGKSSCWIRIVTAAGGSGWGFAQGLHTGTEVVIAHIDGDPDRPVIVGSVMNYEQPAAVRKENANQLVISSRQGISMKFSDA